MSKQLPDLRPATLTYLPALSCVPRASWDRSVKALGREATTGDYYCYCSVDRGQWLPRGVSHSWWNSRHQERLFWATDPDSTQSKGLDPEPFGKPHPLSWATAAVKKPVEVRSIRALRNRVSSPTPHITVKDVQRGDILTQSCTARRTGLDTESQTHSASLPPPWYQSSVCTKNEWPEGPQKQTGHSFVFQGHC